MGSCKPIAKKQHRISFYHWKSKAIVSDEIREVLTQVDTPSVYMRYFDIVLESRTLDDKEGVYPTYMLTEVHPHYQR